MSSVRSERSARLDVVEKGIITGWLGVLAITRFILIPHPLDLIDEIKGKTKVSSKD